jgi:predicted kinase
MSGLPGTGKSALADALGEALPAPVFSVDPIESAILAAGIERSFETGLAAYVVAQRLAADHLALGQTVIADAANYVEEARQRWREIAAERRVPMLVIECVCSDGALHRQRLESRRRGLHPSFHEPSWEDIQRRGEEAPPWREETLVVDSVRPLAENVTLVLERLAGLRR